MRPRKCNALKKQLTWELFTPLNLTIIIPSPTCNPQLLVYSFSLPLTCRSFSLAPTWQLPAGGGHILPSPWTFPDQSLQLWCFGDAFQAQVSLLMTVSAWSERLKKKLVLIEPEEQEPGTTMTVQIILLPCSPNFSLHFSQDNCNNLFLLFPSLEFMYEEMVWMTEHPAHLPWAPAGDLGHCPYFGTPLFVRGAAASHSLFQKGGGELSSMWLCHHPDLAGHHHQWQVKSSARQIPAVSNSETTLSSSLSCSYISLSTPETIPFCFTLRYPHTHFLHCSPVTSLPLPKFGLCFRYFWVFLVKQWD